MQDTPINALICQHVFPGNGGSRVDKLVKYLPQHGVTPTVLAGYEGDNPPRREKWMTQSMPENLLVEHVRARGPTFFHSRFNTRGPAANRYTLYKYLSLPERSIYVPDHMVRWVGRGKRRARAIVEENGIQLVFTSSPRESTHLIGLWLKENFGVPWIADFRDLWTHKSLAYRPATPLHDWWIRRLEKRIMATADHIVANTEENRQIYLRDFGLPEDRVTTVPNGFDRSDIDLDEAHQFAVRKFRVGHMGSLTKTSYPWREFFDAFARLADRVGHEHVEFVHCGNHTDDVTQYVERNNLHDIFNYAGKLSHFDAMKLMAGTDVQLVLLYDNEDSYTLAPQKLYNYMILPGPILSLAPQQGAVARITDETRCGVVIAPDAGGDAVYEQLVKYYEAWDTGTLRYEPDIDALDNYDRCSQAGKIAAIMKSMV